MAYKAQKSIFKNTHRARFINPIYNNPRFELFTKSVESCIRNQLEFDEILLCWKGINQRLTSTNYPLDFANLLEKIKIVEAEDAKEKEQAPVKRVLRSSIKNKSSKLQTYFPWADSVIRRIKKQVTKPTIDLLSDYADYMEAYIPKHRKSLPSRGNVSKVIMGTLEHDLLVEISKWVANKSGIPYCHEVFDAILKVQKKPVLNSGDVFKAATQCPHKLFRLFMQSDFSHYDLNNGEALIHLLFMPLAIDPDEDGEAHLHPDYPFFGNDIFQYTTFNVSPLNLAILKNAWGEFYKLYNSLQKHKPYYGAGDLFSLTVDSLQGDISNLTESDLRSLLYEIRPNIWGVNSWLHLIALDPKSTQWTTQSLACLGVLLPPPPPYFVGYIFEVADYVYHGQLPDLSSRILLSGMIQVVYWSDKQPDVAYPFITPYLGVLYNHRRTDVFKDIGPIIIFAMGQPSQTAIHRGIHTRILYDILYGLIINIDFESVETIGNNVNLVSDSSPCCLKLYLSQDFSHLSAYQEKDPINNVLGIMVAALNSNGGDILISLPTQASGELTKNANEFLEVLGECEISAKLQNFTYFNFRLIKGQPYQVLITLYRSSRPVYIMRQGLFGLQVMKSSDGTSTIHLYSDATRKLAEHFPMFERRHAFVLSC